VRTEEEVEHIQAALAGLPDGDCRAGIVHEARYHVLVHGVVSAGFIEIELRNAFAGLVLNFQTEGFVTRIGVVGRLARGNDGGNFIEVFLIFQRFEFPGGRINSVLKGELVVGFAGNAGPGGVRAVRKLYKQVVGFGSGANDVRLELIKLFVRVVVLVNPFGGADAHAFVFRSGRVEIQAGNRYARLVFEVESERHIGDHCGFFGRRFGFGGGFRRFNGGSFGDGGFFGGLRGGGRRRAGNRDEDHRQGQQNC
jgi:hypothetical protein